MNPHEYCNCDDSNKVLCRLEIRQTSKTKINENVKNVLYIIEGNDAAEEMLDYRGIGMFVIEISHRSGLYNTMPVEGVRRLVDLMQEFDRQHMY